MCGNENGLNVFQHYELMFRLNIWHILRLWLFWKSRQYQFVRATNIVVNLVFSGVLRDAGGRHV